MYFRLYLDLKQKNKRADHTWIFQFFKFAINLNRVQCFAAVVTLLFYHFHVVKGLH